MIIGLFVCEVCDVVEDVFGDVWLVIELGVLCFDGCCYWL